MSHKGTTENGNAKARDRVSVKDSSVTNQQSADPIVISSIPGGVLDVNSVEPMTVALRCTVDY